MKEKILTSLKTRYKTMGFSDKVFDGVADMLVNTITEDAQLDTGIAGVELLLKGLQGDIDKRVTDAVTKVKKDLTPPEKKDDAEAEKPKDGDEPAWLKNILKQQKELSDKLAAMEGQTLAKSHNEIMLAKLTEANVPEVYYKPLIAGRNFKDLAEVESFANESVTNWKALEQTVANKDLGQNHVPFTGKTNNEGISADTANYVANKIAAKAEMGVNQGKQLIPKN